MTTVRDVQQLLSTLSPEAQISIEAQTIHSTASTGIYLRVSVKAGETEFMSMVSDNRAEAGRVINV